MASAVKFHFSKPEESTGYLLWQVTMVWQRKMNRELGKIGLTHTQFVVLAALGWLSKNKKEVSQKDIAEQSNTDRMMVSKILKTLQKKELISRQENEADTRAKLVLLTKTGVVKLQEALKIVEETDDSFFSPLNQRLDFNKELGSLIEKM